MIRFLCRDERLQQQAQAIMDRRADLVDAFLIEAKMFGLDTGADIDIDGAELICFAQERGWRWDTETAIKARIKNAASRNLAQGITPGHRHWVKTPQEKTIAFWIEILRVFETYDRMTVRQLYYQLVGRSVIEKTEAAYERVTEAAVQMRLAGVLAYDQFLDGSRQRRKIAQYDSLEEAMERTQRYYRQDLWANQRRRVEVWCEKDALSGVFLPICQAYGVPYVATRGYSSMTLIYETALEAKERDTPTIIFYFGDHDPSGRNMGDNLQGDFDLHGADVTVEGVALNPEQVVAYRLPTRPSKAGDSRSVKFTKEFGEGSVELDALPPDVLSDLIEETIKGEIDLAAWQRLQEEERLAKEAKVEITRNLTDTNGHNSG